MKTLVEKEEVVKLSELEASLFGEKAWSLELLKKEIENPYSKVYVLEDEFFGVVGYIIVRVFLDEAEILRLGVKKERQGLGFGRVLLSYVLDELKKEGIKKCFLEVAEDNMRAQKLYEAFGFSRIGKRKGYFTPEKSAYVMCKILEGVELC